MNDEGRLYTASVCGADPPVPPPLPPADNTQRRFRSPHLHTGGPGTPSHQWRAAQRLTSPLNWAETERVLYERGGRELCGDVTAGVKECKCHNRAGGQRGQ